MEQKCIFWQSINALPLFSATIQITLDETDQQHSYLLHLKNANYHIEKNLVKRIITFYQSQLDNIMYYQEQLKRWLASAEISSGDEKLAIILDLNGKVEKLKNLSHSIIQTASSLILIEDDSSQFVSITNYLDFVNGQFKEKNNVDI